MYAYHYIIITNTIIQQQKHPTRQSTRAPYGIWGAWAPMHHAQSRLTPSVAARFAKGKHLNVKIKKQARL